MTLEVLSSKKKALTERLDLNLLKHLLETHPEYCNQKWDKKAAVQFFTKPDDKPKVPAPTAQTERRQCLDRILARLGSRDIAAKDLVEDYFRDQYRRQCSANTIRNTFAGIDSFLTFLRDSEKHDLSVVTHRDLLAYIEHEQDRGMSAQTVNVRIRYLRTFLRFLMERDVIHPEVIAKKITIKVPDGLPRAMDPGDVEQLLGVLESVRDRAMIMVLLRTGMRIGELLNTLITEVSLAERRIEIYEAEKTRVGRVVYVSDDACSALKSWFEIRDCRNDYVFYTHRERMSYAAARCIFVQYLEKAGISHKGYTLHSLRHTFASELLNAGMRLECLQPLMGHSSIEMTRRYARLTDKTREEDYFKAMEIIEEGGINGHYRMDHQLQEIFEAEKLFAAHHQKLYEHPQALYPVAEGSGGGSDSQDS